MSDLLDLPKARSPVAPKAAASALDALATLLIFIVAIAILYLAREILVPIAIAILLSFVLSPFVKVLRNLGLGKTFAVVSVVLATFLVAIGLGAILAGQISDLAGEAPRYQSTVVQKVERVQAFIGTNPMLAKINGVIANITGKADNEADKAKSSPPPSPPPGNAPANGKKPPAPEPAKPNGPMQVEIVSPAPGVLTILQTVIGFAASPIASAAFVAIFIVFILMQREDLRNRFIRLVGFGDLHRTTLAMNDAARRLSRYFLAQVLLNTAFGAVMGAALLALGVPGAILWGIVAIFMRFIPYIGSIGAALFPVAIAAAASPGWTLAIETIALFALAEFFVGQVVEPLVYGRHTGISPIAVVASATFWTWLWGPVGLVLSTPLTVCLVVMGRHVDRLAFLDILLGDAPPLTQVESFYQRMLAGDPSEIADHAETYLRDHTLLDYCDAVAMKALLMAQSDVRRGVLEDERQSRIRDTMRDLVDDIGDAEAHVLPLKLDPAAPPAASPALDQNVADAPGKDTRLPDGEIDPGWLREGAVVCVAGRTPLDEAAAHLLADLLKMRGIGTHVEPAERLVANDLTDLRAIAPKLVILSFLDADLSTAQARFAVRRLRRHAPDVPVVAAFWMAEEDAARTTALCSEVRCDTCVSSLPEAMRLCLDRAIVPHADPAPAEPGAHSANLQLSSI